MHPAAGVRTAKYPTKLRRNYPRSRNGCLTCRQRKKKCDEAHPQCAGCLRNQLSCVWPAVVSGRRPVHEDHHENQAPSQAQVSSTPVGTPTGTSTGTPNTPSVSGSSIDDTVFCCPISSAMAVLRRRPRPLLAWEDLSSLEGGQPTPPEPSGPPTHSADDDPPDAEVTWSPTLGVFAAPAPLAVEARRVAAMTPLSAVMLRQFIVRTAAELAVTAGPANPFLAAVLPLAYSDDLVMHCVVALGGAGLSAQSVPLPSAGETALALTLTRPEAALHEATTRHYACVLRSLRAALRSLQPGDTPQVLRTLLVLVLLAVYECSSWNVLDGGVFAHLGAARQLVAWLRAASLPTADDRALFGALLELYAYLVLANRVTPDGALDGTRRVVGPDGSAADEDFVRDPALLADPCAFAGNPYGGVRFAGLHKLVALIPPVSRLAGLVAARTEQTGQPPSDPKHSQRRIRAESAILRRRTAAWQLPVACLARAHNDQDRVWWRAMGEVYRHALLIFLETVEIEGGLGRDDGDQDDDNLAEDPSDAADAGDAYTSDIPPLVEAALQRYIHAIGQATIVSGLVASRFVSISLWPLVVIGSVLDRATERSYLVDGLRSAPAFWGALRAADVLELQWRCRDAAAARQPKAVCKGLPAYYGPSGLARVMRENKINLCIY